MKVQTMV